MSIDIQVGKVALRFCGVWNSSLAYSAFDCVKNEHESSFVALKDVPIGIPLNNTEHWYRQTDFDYVANAEAARVLEFETKIRQINSDVDDAETYKNQAFDYMNQSNTSATNAANSDTSAGQHAVEALNNKLSGITTHNESITSHPAILSDMQRIEDIARGRAWSKVFDTKSEMDAWLLIPENVAQLQTGDNLYIRAVGVHDWWWDGTSAQELEAEEPDLTDYVTKVQLSASLPMAIEQSDYDALVSSGTVEAGRIYYIVPDGTLA